MIHTLTYPPQHPRSAMGGYRYFFNGQEADNEVLGDGGFQNYGFRMYDTRFARFWGVDPLAKDYPMLTPFQFASCSPVLLVDVDGLEGKENTIGYTSDGIPFYYFNARQSTYVKPKALPEVELKRPLSRVVTNQHIPYQGEIRPAKSAYEKEWELSAGFFANNIRNDRVLQSVSLGIFTAFSWSVGEQVVTKALPYVMKSGEELYSLGLKIYNNPWGKRAIGVGSGIIANEQKWSPDISFPDPLINIYSQSTQIFLYSLEKANPFFYMNQKNDTGVKTNNNEKPNHTQSTEKDD